MLISGCLNQAKRILEKYDEILYSPAPEKLINETHKSIRDLLDSPACEDFLESSKKDDKESVAAGDCFVGKIIEAVSPIIPITLSNTALDGSYLRTSLILLGAAEILFTQ